MRSPTLTSFSPSGGKMTPGSTLLSRSYPLLLDTELKKYSHDGIPVSYSKMYDRAGSMEAHVVLLPIRTVFLRASIGRAQSASANATNLTAHNGHTQPVRSNSDPGPFFLSELVGGDL